MRLSEFLLQEMEAILVEWEAFAATLLPAAHGMSSLALRDHAQHILEAVAEDLETSQTAEEQEAKSKGLAAGPVAAEETAAQETAAQTHAVLRARSGFDINQLVAEYRALRATVLRHWAATVGCDGLEVEEIIRFNEAIDQAVAESVAHYHAQVERSRNLFLGMLGHDMRSPLNTIVATSSYLAALNAGEEVSRAAARLIRSGSSMRRLLDDLVDFNRTRLGPGIEVTPSEIDLEAVVTDELEQFRGAHPERRIELEARGDLQGRWDGDRLQQLLRNLISNALKFGDPESPVRVVLDDGADEVRLEVTNRGPAIESSERRRMFDPLRRGTAEGSEDAGGERSGLGLGLFIVNEITKAHGGEVEVRCEEGENTFSVCLPRADRGAAS